MEALQSCSVTYDFDTNVDIIEGREAIIGSPVGRFHLRLAVFSLIALSMSVLLLGLVAKSSYTVLLVGLFWLVVLVGYRSPARMIAQTSAEKVARRQSGDAGPSEKRTLIIEPERVQLLWSHGRLDVTWSGVDAVVLESWGVRMEIAGMAPLGVPDCAFGPAISKQQFVDVCLGHLNRSINARLRSDKSKE
jgi:hypothetical protein